MLELKDTENFLSLSYQKAFIFLMVVELIEIQILCNRDMFTDKTAGN